MPLNPKNLCDHGRLARLSDWGLAMSVRNDRPILPYEVKPAAVLPWDARSPDVAQRVIALIAPEVPEATVEHIGSTAVPGCDGKGVIDLMLVYPAGALEVAKAAVDRLGFQRWDAPGAHPESRPVRIGAIEHDGALFRIHVHLLEADAAEVEQQRLFRDRLRANPALVANYVAVKREIIERGITWGPSFGEAKSAFIAGVRGKS